MGQGVVGVVGEMSETAPSASGVAVRVSAVYVCTLVVVPFPSHCVTHQLCWWHIRITVGVSGMWSRTVQSLIFSPIRGTCCSGGPVSCTSWSISSGVTVSSFSSILSLRAVGCPTASSHVSVTADKVLVPIDLLFHEGVEHPLQPMEPLLPT